jgi:phosphohistidine phosphatase
MREREFSIDVVATSPLVRAQETAVLMLQCGGVPPSLETWSELGPGGTVEAVIGRLAQLDPEGSVLIVSHEPLLSALVSAGIGGGRVRLAKGALAHVRGFVPQVAGELDWLVTPAVIAPGP